MDQIRYFQYHHKGIKNNFEELAPTSSSIAVHIKRAYLQCYQWVNATYMNIQTLNPLDHGYELQDDLLVPTHGEFVNIVINPDSQDSFYGWVEELFIYKRGRTRWCGVGFVAAWWNGVLSTLLPDPILWTSENVKQWLDWAVKEYGLHDMDSTKFTCVGKDLCRLTREDFSRLTTPYNGEILFSHLSFLRQRDGTIKDSLSDSIFKMKPKDYAMGHDLSYGLDLRATNYFKYFVGPIDHNDKPKGMQRKITSWNLMSIFRCLISLFSKTEMTPPRRDRCFCLASICDPSKVFTKKKTTPKVMALPSTSKILLQHVLRAHLQVMLWKAANCLTPINKSNNKASRQTAPPRHTAKSIMSNPAYDTRRPRLLYYHDHAPVINCALKQLGFVRHFVSVYLNDPAWDKFVVRLALAVVLRYIECKIGPISAIKSSKDPSVGGHLEIT
ncbi:Friend leukemia integration 1 transcription factor [Nymphon striatum]|nr:Friend leukemia integration 1 transcription factor [Nymphon striatum]